MVGGNSERGFKWGWWWVKLFVGGKGYSCCHHHCPPSAHRILTVNDLTNARASY